jgi:hypothetical protein
LEKMKRLLEYHDENRQAAFEKRFKGTKYVKTTFWKYNKLWMETDTILKSSFIDLGRSNKALFSHFIAATKNPCLRPGPCSPDASSRSSQTPSDSSPSRPSMPIDLDGFHGNADLNDKVEDARKADTSGCGGDRGLGDGVPERVDDSAHDDTSRLCEFCDETILSAPSAILIAMREGLQDCTWLDPQPDNMNHRSARSFTVYSTYCERHRFETDHLPNAIKHGWPMKIDFHKLYDRILAHREEIEEIMAEPGESEFFELARKASTSKGKGKCLDGWDRFTEQSTG